MTKHTLRAVLTLLSVLFVLACLPACGNAEKAPSAPTLTLQDGTLTYATALDAVTLQSHTGQKAYLYELAPGESEEALAGRAPILSCNVEQTLRFRFPLEENGITRRYNSYLLAFSDGTLLSHLPVSLSNASAATEPFPHGGTIKGLEAGRASAATAFNAHHAVLELRLSRLFEGDGFPISFNGTSYQLNSDRIALADALLTDAARHNQQITLLLEIDTAPNAPEFAALLDALLTRYTGGDYGTVTALALILPEELTRQADACAS
ncbi:MAG: hypothetical protein E7620_07365, partial [Ruminococcaceae bacterium]|nr:hypothetical protein [Oscillospiraceae bacterium]